MSEQMAEKWPLAITTAATFNGNYIDQVDGIPTHFAESIAAEQEPKQKKMERRREKEKIVEDEGQVVVVLRR